MFLLFPTHVVFCFLSAWCLGGCFALPIGTFLVTLQLPALLGFRNPQ
jgi:hypothetical protein